MCLAETASAAPGDQDTLWSQLVETAGRASLFIRSYLLEAHLVSSANGVFTIGLPAEHVGLVDNPRNQELLKNTLAELGHPVLHIKFVKSDRPQGTALPAPPAPAPSGQIKRAASNNASSANISTAKPATSPPSKPKPASPAAINKEEFKDDPLIRQALELFKGQIVDAKG